MRHEPEDDPAEYIRSRARYLKGLSLEDLGAAPDPTAMSAEEKRDYDSDHLEELAALSAQERERRHYQAELLAGALWHASVTMVDHLFEDLRTISDKTDLSAADLDGTWILPNLPPRFARRYGPLFVQKFIAVTVDMTASLARSWRSPDCVAGELALRCLLDEAETVVDLYGLDVPEYWREDLEDRLVEDFDYDMLYDLSLDGFENDPEFLDRFRIVPMRFEDWFKPFHDEYAVPPYARD